MKLLKTIILLILIPMVGLSYTLPDLGDSDRVSILATEAQMIGYQVVIDLMSHDKITDDYVSYDYLNQIGNKLVMNSTLPLSKFNFYLVNDHTINAFALPGGYICVNTGLIYATMNEDELASVMAHEIGHVTQHHVFRNVNNYNKSNLIATAGTLAGIIMAPFVPALAILTMQGSSAYALSNVLSFSRDMEREADRVGQNMMESSGYDPHAMPVFFQTLENQEKFDNQEVLFFLRTHPVTIERISDAQLRARNSLISMHADSISFLLVREMSRVNVLGAKTAIEFYQDAIKYKKYTSINAQYFGMAYASYKLNKFSQARAYFNKIKDISYQNSPAMLDLSAKLYIMTNKPRLALAIYQKGVKLYPNCKSMWMGEINTLFELREYHDLSNKLNQLTDQEVVDIDVLDLIIKLYSDSYMNQPFNYHYYYALELFQVYMYKQALQQINFATPLAQTQEEQIMLKKLNDNILYQQAIYQPQ